MSGPAALGEFEQIVLLALLRLGDEAYGVAVADEIAERAGRRVSLGAIYTTLDRMESKGLVGSRIGESTAERGGRAKRYFRPTADGIRALEASQRVLARMKEGLALP